MPYKDLAKRREAAKRHYEKHQERFKERMRAYHKRERDEVKKYIVAYLSQNPCMDCGEQDIIVLEFDHRDPSQKKFNIGSGVRYATLTAIKKEIAKCDIRCANCHRRKTFKGNSYREKVESGPRIHFLQSIA